MSFAGGGTTNGILFTATRGTSAGASFQNQSAVTKMEIDTSTYVLKAYGDLNCTGELSGTRLKLFNTLTTLTGSTTVAVATYQGGLIKYNIGGNVTQTTTSAANIISSVGSVVGTTFSCEVYQNANRSITVTGGTGVTVFDGRNSNSIASFNMVFIVTSGTTVDLLLN